MNVEGIGPAGHSVRDGPARKLGGVLILNPLKRNELPSIAPDLQDRVLKPAICQICVIHDDQLHARCQFRNEAMQ